MTARHPYCILLPVILRLARRVLQAAAQPRLLLRAAVVAKKKWKKGKILNQH
jgi:hypothetical protein